MRRGRLAVCDRSRHGARQILGAGEAAHPPQKLAGRSALGAQQAKQTRNRAGAGRRVAIAAIEREIRLVELSDLEAGGQEILAARLQVRLRLLNTPLSEESVERGPSLAQHRAVLDVRGAGSIGAADRLHIQARLSRNTSSKLTRYHVGHGLVDRASVLAAPVTYPERREEQVAVNPLVRDRDDGIERARLFKDHGREGRQPA